MKQKFVDYIKSKNPLVTFSGFEWFLFSVLVGLMVWLTQYNITTAYFQMDSDVVVDQILIPKIISERGIFFNDYIFGHEAMHSRPFFITLFFRLFTSDWILAAKLSITVTTLVIVALFYTLCRRVGFTRCSAFLSLIFLLGVNISIFNNFRGANFYPTFVILPLLNLILLIDLKKSDFALHGKPLNICKLVALVLLSLLGGLFGIRMLAVLYIPLLAVEFFHTAGNIRAYQASDEEDRDTFLAPILRQKGLFVAVMLTGVNLAGMMILSEYNDYAGAYVPAITSVASWSHISENVWPAAQRALLSNLSMPLDGVWSSNPDYIAILAEAVLRVFMYACVVIILARIIKKRKSAYSGETVFAADYFAMTVPIIIVITVLIGQPSPKYYYFNWYVIAFAVACITDKLTVKTMVFRRFAAIMIAATCAVSIYMNDYRAVKSALEKDKTELTHYRVADYLVANGYDCVYGEFWQSALIAGYGNMEFDFGHITMNGFRAYVWAVDKRSYYDNNKGKYAIVLSDADYEKIMESSPQYKLDYFEERTRYITRIGHLNLYETDINPVPLFRTPRLRGDTNVYDFSQNYVSKSPGVFISYDDNYIESAGATGLVTSGSAFRLLKGEYRLTVHYEYVGEGGSAQFSVTAGADFETVSVPLTAGQTTAEAIITLPEHNDGVNLAVNVTGGNIRLYKVEVTKIS